MRYLTFLLIIPFASLKAQMSIGNFLIEDHLVSATHSGGCNTQHLIGPPDNTCMANMVDNSSVSGNFSAAWPDRPGIDLVYENCYTTGDCSLRLILTDGSLSAEHIVPFTGFDTLGMENWTFTAVPSCGTIFLFGNSAKKIAPLDFDEHFDLAPQDSVSGIQITFLPGFNTDPAGVYIVSDLATSIADVTSIKQQAMLVAEMLNIQELRPGTEILILDHLGRTIHSSTVDGDAFSLNTSSWPAGAYVGRLAHGGQVNVLRFMKVAE